MLSCNRIAQKRHCLSTNALASFSNSAFVVKSCLTSEWSCRRMICSFVIGSFASVSPCDLKCSMHRSALRCSVAKSTAMTMRISLTSSSVVSGAKFRGSFWRSFVRYQTCRSSICINPSDFIHFLRASTCTNCWPCFGDTVNSLVLSFNCWMKFCSMVFVLGKGFRDSSALVSIPFIMKVGARPASSFVGRCTVALSQGTCATLERLGA